MACADSAGAAEWSGAGARVSLWRVAFLLLYVFSLTNAGWMDGQLDSPDCYYLQNACAFGGIAGGGGGAGAGLLLFLLPLAFGPWDSTGLSAIQLKPVNL